MKYLSKVFIALFSVVVLLSSCGKDETETCTELTYYADTDGDGLGDPSATQLACEAPDGYVLNSSDDDDTVVFSDTEFTATDWTDETHSKSADPNFDKVFEDDTVKRLDFVISAARWQSMLEDMTSTYGSFGASGGGGGLVESDEDPIFVPGEVFFEGKQWYKVGLRFKGQF